VRVAGRPFTKPGTIVAPTTHLDIERPRAYVSRGGEKLERALTDFALDVREMRALDVGASTGGFTDCLLSHGATHVTALDVGYGQLAYEMRVDPRVTVMERCNFRLLPDDTFGREFDLVVVDASFISAIPLLERASRFLRRCGEEGALADGQMVVLIKPQFEAGRAAVARGGVVRDVNIHRSVLTASRWGILGLGLYPTALALSCLRGPAGNIEFFVRIEQTGEAFTDEAIDAVLTQAAESNDS
jgi:23S rRNA (cytidine1920-2'-O)/16S rRNA (cytidine1409-2'-O)-methyltransferase